jgi:hypothetical protein
MATCTTYMMLNDLLRAKLDDREAKVIFRLYNVVVKGLATVPHNREAKRDRSEELKVRPASQNRVTLIGHFGHARQVFKALGVLSLRDNMLEDKDWDDCQSLNQWHGVTVWRLLAEAVVHQSGIVSTTENGSVFNEHSIASHAAE